MAVLRILVAAAAVALAGTAAAQTPPAFTGPYYIVDADAETAFLIAGGTRARSRDVGSVTAVVLVSPASQAQNNNVARLDMAYEFQCANSTLRNVRTSFYRADGTLLETLDNTGVQWEAVSPGASSEVMMAYACSGTLPEGAEPLVSLEGIQSGFAAWSATQ